MTKKENILEKILISFKNDDVDRYSLALHSEDMFYSLKKKHFIDKINCETNKMYSLRHLAGSSYNVVTVDQKENRLFWIDLSNSSHLRIGHQASNIGDLQMFDVYFPVINITTFNIHQRWLYIGDETSIWCIDKKTGTDMIRVVSNHEWNSGIKIFGGKVFDLNVLHDERRSACGTNNGGCEQFCFDRKTVSCGCRDGMRVVQDVHCE